MRWLILAVALSACGDSLCEDLITADVHVVDTARSCGLIGMANLEKDRCEEGRDACSAHELDLIRIDIDCINRIKPCVPGKEDAFLEVVTTCNSVLDAVGDSCLLAVFGPAE